MKQGRVHSFFLSRTTALTLHTTAHLNELHLRVNEELSRYKRMAQDASRTKLSADVNSRVKKL